MSKIYVAIYYYPTTLYSFLQIYAQLLIIDTFSQGYYILKYAKTGLVQLAQKPLTKELNHLILSKPIESTPANRSTHIVDIKCPQNFQQVKQPGKNSRE